MELIKLPPDLEARDFVAVEITREESKLICQALRFAGDEAFVFAQMPIEHAAVMALAVHDWANDWRRGFEEASLLSMDEAFAEPGKYALQLFLVDDEKQDKYVVFGDARILSRLQTILSFGQCYAKSDSFLRHIYMRDALSDNLFLAPAIPSEADVQIEVEALFDRFTAMRKAI